MSFVSSGCLIIPPPAAKNNSMRLTLSVLLLSLSVALAGDTFVVNCAPLTIQRADPIVTPGKPSQHVHAIVGGNAFRRTMSDANSAEIATATTCDKKLDHSNYWVPHLYHKDAQGRYSLVPWTGTAIYYQNRACDYIADQKYCPRGTYAAAFPKGLRVIAGDPNKRTYNESDVRDRAVQMMCMGNGYSKEYHGFPTQICNQFIRAEVYFPSCWDGKNLDSPNHRDHMAYPSADFDGGVCPPSHPIALISIFFEFFFDTSAITDLGNFYLSNGDNTGYSFHGDFVNGWTNLTALGEAHRLCVGPDNCPINTLGAPPGQNHPGPQDLIYPAVYEEEIGLHGPVDHLPGQIINTGTTSNGPIPTTSSSLPTSTVPDVFVRNVTVATAAGQYFSSTAGDPVLRTGRKASVYEVNVKGGAATLFDVVQKKFVTAEDAGRSALRARSFRADTWETFSIVETDKDVFVLKAKVNGKAVRVHGENLIADGEEGSPLTFKWM
ncbi:hypothetical protein PROFUN_03333 [Planoprotostelium fungivorum]|uniref:DUF1996 domain-containing protein n=1 Tax=Planoprotostelium fungivorum TaxID=1890364 RepID=A0A2P6NWT9_9EUKA|nr:hypothetical protein PROFUN_03333 [Planoprotostelium fungivorum]